MATSALLALGCSSTPAATPPTCQGDGVALTNDFCVVNEIPEVVDAGAGLSLSRDVQPVFDHFCVVVGCHVSGNPPKGLNLAPGFSHDDLLNNPPLVKPVLPDGTMLDAYVVPGDLEHSYLHYKIHPDIFPELSPAARLGLVMPAPRTESAFDPNVQGSLIDQWITGGALP